MPEDERNVTFAHIQPDVVTKPDGRYLIYFSWPELDDESASAEVDEQAARAPAQQPWSPQGGPADE